ncbi:MAG TPA: nickel pincer cofactor biosynthesis protein LarC [Terriglobia bacterium]|nr:nickel pincer cofactor biosynthesis protein LarC [Terriglobia bacterium]
MRTLYFDCFSGISGDMTVGAMLDLGLDLEYLRSELAKLPVEGYTLAASRVVRANISATKFDVVMDGATPAHTHAADHSHDHGHADGHSHDHAHAQTPGAGVGHFHRKASEIIRMIQTSALSANARRMAEAIFAKLAISEGAVHRVAPEDVEFHEVGAIDSIVDTVGAAIGFDALGVEQFICSPINVGAGFIHCQHGVYPVPAPATADLLRGANIYSAGQKTELVTPTGAAILAATVSRFDSLRDFAIDRIGYGAGSKQFQDFPNCLRIFLGAEGAAGGRDAVHPMRSAADAGVANEVDVIQADIDDMNPQNLPYVIERLLGAGALDVTAWPVMMKKGRTGQRLEVLAPLDRSDALCRVVFEETTTIGLRRHRTTRSVLEREVVQVDTVYGVIGMKVSRLDGVIVNVAPEFEDCVRLARERGAPLKEVQSAALRRYFEPG